MKVYFKLLTQGEIANFRRGLYACRKNPYCTHIISDFIIKINKKIIIVIILLLLRYKQQSPDPMPEVSSSTGVAADDPDFSTFENKTGLAEDMKFLARMPELCDVTFLVGETREPVCAVKAVLAARSK